MVAAEESKPGGGDTGKTRNSSAFRERQPARKHQRYEVFFLRPAKSSAVSVSAKLLIASDGRLWEQSTLAFFAISCRKSLDLSKEAYC